MSSKEAAGPTSPAFLFLDKARVGRTLLSDAFDLRDLKNREAPACPLFPFPIFLSPISCPDFRSPSPQLCHSDRSRPPQRGGLRSGGTCCYPNP
jgi:hypothetical protein